MCDRVSIYVVTFVFFNDTATTEIYTLSLHDALPIWPVKTHILRHFVKHIERGDARCIREAGKHQVVAHSVNQPRNALDRKSTRLNSSHANISYAVFCLKKKNTATHTCY